MDNYINYKNLQKDKENLINETKNLSLGLSNLSNLLNSVDQKNKLQKNQETSKNKMIKKGSKKMTNRSNISKDNNSFITKNITSSRKSIRSSSVSKTTLKKSKSINVNKIHNLKEKEENDNTNFKKEINNLNKQIADIKFENYLDTLQLLGDIYLLNELNIWKQKTEKIGKNYMDNLNVTKRKLYNEKAEYLKQMDGIKKECHFLIKSTQDKCQNIIEKQEFIIESYLEKNEEIRKKLEKLKNVFSIKK